MIRLLSNQEYQATFESPMQDVTATAQPIVDIWPYVNLLVQNKIVAPHVFIDELVEYVYRNGNATYDHVLLPTDSEKLFIVIVVSTNQAAIYGHYLLDLAQEYGIKDQLPDFPQA